MDWTPGRLAQYARWKSQVGYHALRRRLGVAHARVAYWIPERSPDFLGIGAPRTASTWLYQRLSLHPDICLAKRKEIHFFDVPEGNGTYVYGPDARRPALRPLDLDNRFHWRWYRSHFGNCGGRMSGEFTPDYTLLDAGRIGVVKEHLPDVKLIYAMRNPVTRAWSSVRKELWRRFRMHPRNLQDGDTLVRMATRPGVLARGDYISAITNWETHYQGQILYLFYDDIVANPQAVLHRVCDFLGVDQAPLDTAGGHDARVNDVPADEIPMEVRVALERHYAPQQDFLSQKFGRSFAHWFWNGEPWADRAGLVLPPVSRDEARYRRNTGYGSPQSEGLGAGLSAVP
jgi:hypothetical protein